MTELEMEYTNKLIGALSVLISTLDIVNKEFNTSLTGVSYEKREGIAEALLGMLDTVKGLRAEVREEVK